MKEPWILSPLGNGEGRKGPGSRSSPNKNGGVLRSFHLQNKLASDEPAVFPPPPAKCRRENGPQEFNLSQLPASFPQLELQQTGSEEKGGKVHQAPGDGHTSWAIYQTANAPTRREDGVIPVKRLGTESSSNESALCTHRLHIYRRCVCVLHTQRERERESLF